MSSIHSSSSSRAVSPNRPSIDMIRASPVPSVDDDNSVATSSLLSPSPSVLQAQGSHAAPIKLQSLSNSNTSSDGSATASPRKLVLPGAKKQSWLKIWLWEILSAIFSLLCVGAVVVILIYMDGKLLEDWEFSISPNSLVSVFMTLAKTAMLVIVAESIGQLKWSYIQEKAHPMSDLCSFDEASRAPWGATKLVWKIRWHAIAASAGGLITVASLAMDPFTQQVIGTQSTTRNVTGSIAQIQNARAWDFDGDMGSDFALQMNITAATFSGLFDSAPDVDFACSSGNCTWPPFYSLGICSECRNLTDQVSPTCNEPSNDGQLCNITFGDLTVQAISKVIPAPFDHSFNQTILNITAKARNPWGENDIFNADLGYLLAVHSPAPSGGNSGELPEPNIYSCDLSLCRKQYASNTTNGILRETLLESKELVFPDCGILTGPWYTTTNGRSRGSCPGWPADSPVPPNLTASDKAALLADDSIVWVNPNVLLTWRVWFSSMLTQTMSAGASDSFDIIYDWQSALPSMLWLANSGDFMQSINSTTAAMSKTIRQGPNVTWIDGTSQLPATRVHVRWQWIALPLALTVFSIVLLGVAIKRSEGADKVIWKSSILATLFHGVQGGGEGVGPQKLARDGESCQGYECRSGKWD